MLLLQREQCVWHQPRPSPVCHRHLWGQCHRRMWGCVWFGGRQWTLVKWHGGFKLTANLIMSLRIKKIRFFFVSCLFSLFFSYFYNYYSISKWSFESVKNITFNFISHFFKKSKAAVVKQNQFPSHLLSFSLWVLGSLTVAFLLFGHQGRVECWDPRVRNRVGILDCALSSLTEGTEYVTHLPLWTLETAVASCLRHSILSHCVCPQSPGFALS